MSALTDKLIKAEIKNLVRIKDTFDDRFDYLRLDKKERLLPFEENAWKEFKESIRFEDLSGYAELGETYRKLAAHLDVSAENIFLAAGSDLAIKSVYEACLEKGDHIVLHAPGYAMFKVYARMFGVEMTQVSITEQWQPDYDGMLAAVTDKTKLVVIENPNGFVGTRPALADLERCAAQLLSRQVMLMIDEAYFYIEEERCRSHELIRKSPNVIISQTLSKGHGLAGLRVGYLIGEPELIEYISRVRPMHEITSLSALATRWVIDHPELLRNNQQSIKRSKEYLLAEFNKRDITARDTHANFIMVHIPDEGRTQNLTQKLREKKILIRRPFEESFLRGWSLICIGTQEDSQTLIEALDRILVTI